MAVSNPFGVASLIISGDAWNVTKSSCRASNPKREILASQTEIGDYSEMPSAGSITCTVRPRPDQDFQSLANATGVTAVLTERSGVTWYGSQLTQTGEAEYDTAEGTGEIKLEGPIVTRQAAS